MKRIVSLSLFAILLLMLHTTCVNDNIIRISVVAGLKLEVETPTAKASLPTQFTASVTVYVDEEENCTMEVNFEQNGAIHQAVECIEVPLNKPVRFAVAVEIGNDYWQGESGTITIVESETPYLVTVQLFGDEALPVVTTDAVSNITASSASCGGNVTDDGEFEVTAKGVVWDVSQNPTIDFYEGITNDGTGIGAFTSIITDLTAETTYYVRAYATNSAGTSYGNQQEFTTISAAALPTVTTATVTDILATSATGGGNVTDDGGNEVTARGVVWDEVENPTIESNIGITTDGTGTGEFVSSITSLSPLTTYYVRAYATNSEGTSYGNSESFTTTEPGIIYGDGVTDVDGNFYVSVIIGDQEWTAQNLRVTNYADNTPITTGLLGTDWELATEGAYTIYPFEDIDGLNSDAEVLEAYGAFYNWHAVADSRGLCPTGWHVPSNDEITQLIDYVSSVNSEEYVASQLKSCRQVDSPLGGECSTTEHPRWDSHASLYGTDNYGFSALPGGLHDYIDDSYYVGMNGNWWVTTEYDEYDAWGYGMAVGSIEVQQEYWDKNYGRSVRCVKD